MMFKTPVLISILILILILSSMIAGEGSERGTKLKLDFSDRFRLVSWNNPVTLDSSIEEGSFFLRNRISMGLLWKPFSDLDIYFKTTNEFRYYFKPESGNFNINEIFVDSFYFRLKNICGLPVTIVAGRQNFFFGEGFIIVDGGPLDGSRSIWFDAFRTDISFNGNGKLSLFFLSAPERDNLLPVINDRGQLLNEESNRGYGIYYSGKAGKNNIDLYYLRKSSDINNNNSMDKRYNVFGSRIKLPLSADLYFTSEIAYQGGYKDNIPISAVGGYFHLDYRPFPILPQFKQITFGGIYLSGDDPGTNRIEGWDPVFSRWPKWSESFIYTLIKENGVAGWSNFSSLYFSLDFQPFRKGNLKVTWHYLMAPETGFACSLTGSSGHVRGNLYIGRFDYRFNRVLSGHIVWEHFNPGNFYFGKAERYDWFRIEFMYKIK